MNRFELKKCPFCGHDADILLKGTISKDGKLGKEYYIWCPNCGTIRGGTAIVWINYSSILGIQCDETDLEILVEKWNTRCDG